VEEENSEGPKKNDEKAATRRSLQERGGWGLQGQKIKREEETAEKGPGVVGKAREGHEHWRKPPKWGTSK